MEKKIRVLYHADCDDGFGAAWAAWKSLGDNAEYLPVRYGDPPPVIPEGAEVVIVDFSYPREVLMSMAERGRVTVLDHHKTSMDDLMGLPFAKFDMDRSGAGITWDYFHFGQARPPLIDYIEDRDLWRFELVDTNQVSSALRSYPMDFKVWDGLAYNVDILRAEGVSIERYICRLVEGLSKDARQEDWSEGSVTVVNGPGLIASELADYLIEGNPTSDFVAVYRDMAVGRQWSLRSQGDFDVSAVAKGRGGGGHINAAGFTEPLLGRGTAQQAG